MELSKKTTILFSPAEHQRLSEVAARRGMSLGQLVREACTHLYGVDMDTRLAAAAALARLSLPVGTPVAMKRESVPEADDLLP